MTEIDNEELDDLVSRLLKGDRYSDHKNDQCMCAEMEEAASAIRKLRAAIAAMQADRPVAEEVGICGHCKTPGWVKGGIQPCDDEYCTFPYWEAAPAHPADTYAAGWRDRGEADAKVCDEYAADSDIEEASAAERLAIAIRTLPDRGEAK